LTQLADVNTDDIAGAIRLGCQTMCSVFNADDGDIPFFDSRVYPDAELNFHPYHSEAHVPGRHLNALLAAEHALGVAVAEGCIEKHARAAFFSYSGPIPLPLNRETLGGPLRLFLPHNIREGFHALAALVRFRQSARARELAEASIAVINTLWHPQRGWDRRVLEDELGLKVFEIDGPFITGLARAIGPLVTLYSATGYGPALGLALRLAQQVLDEHWLEAGAYDPAHMGTHVHSVTCVMSSVAQLADLLGDMRLLARVKMFYDNGLNDLRDGLGWAIESTRPEANPDFGEINSTGDILETALILGRHGFTEYYGDAERILRGHLLPAQLRDISFIKEPDNPTDADGKRDVARRHRGAFGFPAPYGHHPLGVERFGFNLDIVGGGVASLCAAYSEVARRAAEGHRVILLFDHETDALSIQSPYTHDSLCITVKQAGPLFVRIPAGVAADAITLSGTDGPVRIVNGYVFVENPPLDVPLTFAFPLPKQEIVLRHRTRAIRVRMRGEQVVAMDNFGAELTFFEAMD
jgi:hypothetical protein